jgi:hypothetical protein
MYRWIIALTFFVAGSFQAASAQTAQAAPAATAPVAPRIYRIAVLAPLFLDSAFDQNGNYKLGNQYPKYAFPGLEFAEGARLALDTLQAQGSAIQYFVYDTRSVSGALTKLIGDHSLDSVQLLIGSLSGTDYQMLAQFAAIKHIPFVSATYPNDGGISANPFLVILNPTLYTHCQAIYHFILKNHPTHQILYVRKPGAMEDRLESYFKQLNDNGGKPLLSIQTVSVPDSVSASQLQQSMDSNRISVIVCGSLDETFGTSLVRACSTLSGSYPMTLIGMPNWQGIKALQSPEMRDMPYLVTTSFLSPDTDSTSSPQSVTQRFAVLTGNRPGDMAFRGYESTYQFTNLLLRYQDNLLSHLEDLQYQTYTPFEIKPVFLHTPSSIPDYFENKHVYILRIQNGAVARLQ